MNPLEQTNALQDYLRRYALPGLLTLFLCCSIGSSAQNTPAATNQGAAASFKATHILGFENTKNNSSGDLLLQGDTVKFQQGDKTSTQIKIASVRDVFLNEEDKQVGGVPMTVGKAAAPFGGGRVVSLFAHKNYDILTLEYVDGNGGLHGAVFELSEGKGELLRNELLARGVSPVSSKDQQAKRSTEEVSNENK